MIRGDNDSSLNLWTIPDITNTQIAQLKQVAFGEAEGIPIFEAEESRRNHCIANFHPPGKNTHGYCFSLFQLKKITTNFLINRNCTKMCR